MRPKLTYILIAIGSLLAVYYAIRPSAEVTEEGIPVNSDSSSVEKHVPPQLEFGLPVSKFNVSKSTIKRDEFLADILLEHNVPYTKIAELAEASRDVFDVRDLRAGRPYSVLQSRDTASTAHYFIYQPNPIDYVVYDLRDSVKIYLGQKEVRTEVKSAGGFIKSSLWDALTASNMSPALAVEMSEIYAWTIDFYRIQPGDYFKLVYEAQYVGDEFIGIGEVISALFNYGGTDFYAFTFEQDSIPDYFDERGNSLKKAFLQAPLKYGRISSGYSPRRFHPVQKRYKAHLGTDYAAPRGTPILAVGDGKVIEARFKRYNGNYVKIRHNSTYTTQYLHMTRIAKGINAGAVVRQGDVIGYVGSTGLATGPHVCFRFWKNGKQVNHRNEKLPPSKPIKEEYREEYAKAMRQQKAAIDRVQVELSGES